MTMNAARIVRLAPTNSAYTALRLHEHFVLLPCNAVVFQLHAPFLAVSALIAFACCGARMLREEIFRKPLIAGGATKQGCASIVTKLCFS
jgi:hypothetical protein